MGSVSMDYPPCTDEGLDTGRWQRSLRAAAAHVCGAQWAPCEPGPERRRKRKQQKGGRADRPLSGAGSPALATAQGSWFLLADHGFRGTSAPEISSHGERNAQGRFFSLTVDGKNEKHEFLSTKEQKSSPLSYT